LAQSPRQRHAHNDGHAGGKERTEPAFCVSRATCAYVPIGRAWRHSSGDVRCARSVRGARAQIGRFGCAHDAQEPTPLSRSRMSSVDRWRCAGRRGSASSRSVQAFSGTTVDTLTAAGRLIPPNDARASFRQTMRAGLGPTGVAGSARAVQCCAGPDLVTRPLAHTAGARPVLRPRRRGGPDGSGLSRG
jgi:hypothetical protein